MKRSILAASFVIAAVVAVVFAVHAAALLERDNCLDAGGRYIAGSGLCETGNVAYVALFSRPHLYALWAGFLGAVFAVGMMVHAIVARLLRSPSLHRYLRTVFRWQSGRQGSGYDKMLLLTAPWPIPFDGYLIRYPHGSSVPPHTDPVQGRRHYRLNIILRAPERGGEFACANPIYATRRVKFFRPDRCEHSVTLVEGGSRYVLSIGWLWGRDRTDASDAMHRG